MGASTVNLEDNKPMPTSALGSCLLPSFIFISKTEDNLPPNLAGNPPLYKSILFKASPLNSEKNPNK